MRKVYVESMMDEDIRGTNDDAQIAERMNATVERALERANADAGVTASVPLSVSVTPNRRGGLYVLVLVETQQAGFTPLGM